MSTVLPRPTLSSSNAFSDVASILNHVGELCGEANHALDDVVDPVNDVALALHDVDSFMSLLKDLDEAVLLAADAIKAAAPLLDEIGVGELLTGIATALDDAREVYKAPLQELERVETDTIKAIIPRITELQNALQKVQKELALAQEQLPQYAHTVELVGALMSIFGALVAAFPAETETSPGGRLKALVAEWDKVSQIAHDDATDLMTICGNIRTGVVDKLRLLETSFTAEIKKVMSSISGAVDWLRPVGEMIHHAMNNFAPLKWLVGLMEWLGKALNWLLDQIGLGKLRDELENEVKSILGKLGLDQLINSIKTGFPAEADIKQHVATLSSAPAKLTDLRNSLKAYKTAQGGDPMVPLIQAVLKAVTGVSPGAQPSPTKWHPAPVITQQAADEAIGNRMKYVSQDQQRRKTYDSAFAQIGQLAAGPAKGRPPSLKAPTLVTATAVAAGTDTFPIPVLGPDWNPLTELRNKIASVKVPVSAGATQVADLEAALDAFEAQSALAPLLAADMDDISNIWKDAADIVAKVESIAQGTVLDAPLKGFLDGLRDQAQAAHALAAEAKRFEKNAAALETAVQHADGALRKPLSNAVSHQGGTYVDALIARYNTWYQQTSTLPAAFEQLSAFDQANHNNAHVNAISGLRAKVNQAGATLTETVADSAQHATALQNAVQNLINELRNYAALAVLMNDPVQTVRGHQQWLHTVDHYMNTADSILDPLSWLVDTYVIKATAKFAPIQATMRALHSSGTGQMTGWLQEGVHKAFDGLAEAETHIGAATASLMKVNDALETGGINRAWQAAQDIDGELATLNKDLAIKNADAPTDWLASDTNDQLKALATEIVPPQKVTLQV